ncbi:MAG: Rieske 2Fe-2S domain-containing protein, partial [Xanthobacteraceae bacterium]
MLDQPHAKADGAKPQQEMISGAFLRNAWYVAAWSDELDDGKLVARMFMNEPVVLFRKSNGDVAAIEDRCAHRFAPLSMGKIVGGDRIQCPYHG